MWMHGYPNQRREEKEETGRLIETMMNLDEIDSAIDTFHLLNDIFIEFAFLLLHVKSGEKEWKRGVNKWRNRKGRGQKQKR